MNKTILIMAAFLACRTAWGEGGLSGGDKAFAKGQYQSALALYEQVLAQPQEGGLAALREDRLKAAYRAVECEALLFRYGEAAARLSKMALPSDPLWRARFALLKAGVGRGWLAHYAYGAPDEAREGSADAGKRTAAQWRAGIADAYDSLWPLRHELAAANLENEAYFINLEKAALDAAPTLWDFAAQRWTRFLLENAADAPRPQAVQFAAEQFPIEYAETAAPALKAAAIMEESAALPCKSREFACGNWKIARLLVPSEHPALVSGKDGVYRTAMLETLKKWSDSLAAPDARARAAFEAARLLNADSKYAEAAALCEKIPAAGRIFSRRCAQLLSEIKAPVLQLSAQSAPPPGKGVIAVKARNLPKVYFRAWRTTPEELVKSGDKTRDRWDKLREYSGKELSRFLSRKPDFSWQDEPVYSAPYAYSSFQSSSPALGKGVYMVAACENAVATGTVLAALVNVTDLFLIGSAGMRGDPENFLFSPAKPSREETVDVFRLYAINAVTGRPVQNAMIDALVSRESGGGKAEEALLYTGADGAAAYNAPVHISHADRDGYRIDPLLSAADGWAWWPDGWFGMYTNVPPPVQLFAETDRPVYRPGQTVRFKITALVRQPRGWRVYDGKRPVTVTARDANGREFFSKKLRAGALGSAAGEFTIAPTGLLGGYSLGVSLGEYGYDFYGGAAFLVEEYRRPEFEVKLAAAGAFKYGQKVKIEGAVNYYFGAPVPGASVKYSVVRKRFIPWCVWWRDMFSSCAPAEVAAGQLKTGDDGVFSFEFIPLPEKESEKDWPSTFEVTAEARDAGGRTISDTRGYRGGDKAYIFDIQPDAGFFTAGLKAGFAAKLLNLDEKQLSGAGSWKICRLDNPPKTGRPEPGKPPAFGAAAPLEYIYREVTDGPQIAAGALAFAGDKAAHVNLAPLPEGVYRLTVSAKDPWGENCEQQLILISAALKNSALELPPVAIFERASYQPGEYARALIGSGGLKGVKYMEVWAGENVLSTALIPAGGLTIAELKVDAGHKGGFALRWFGASDFTFYSGMASAAVPRKDRELKLSMKYDRALRPGQKARWTLYAKDSSGKPVSGEAAVRVFDRSLEYYAKDSGDWIDGLYSPRAAQPNTANSLFEPRVFETAIRVKPEEMRRAFREYIAEPKQPSLRFEHGLGGGMLSVESAQLKSADALDGARMLAGGFAAANRADKSAPVPASAGGAAAPEIKPRTDFSETAYFNPQLKLAKGAAAFGFTIPERLTGWKTRAYAMTRDVKAGSVSVETVTRKELMARVEMPRFLREGDRSSIKALITNETAAPLTGEVILSISENGADAAAKFGLAAAVKNFTAAPNGTTAVSWDIAAPRGISAYKVRGAARAGRYADAQENEIPVLPSRSRLVASDFAALDGDSTARLELAELKAEDTSRELESARLQIEPQIALAVLDSLPQLVQYPYGCTEQVLNRYVPLAVVNNLYMKYPQLRQAAAKMPHRTSVTPEWEKENPVRLMTFMESPWLDIAQGSKSAFPVTDLFNPAVVEAQRSAALTKLAALQKDEGSFPWFPGGRPNIHMTPYLLEGLAEAAHYGVPVPRDMARKALAYVNTEIASHLRPAESETALALYAAYVVTSLPKEWPESKEALKNAKVWADFCGMRPDMLTPLGKAYAARVYLRLGEKSKADGYLDMAMDGAREDKTAGLYWTPEKMSWLWYCDTVEKHAFILRALLELRPKDPRAAGMVKWLLFNHKSGQWKSTRAAAAAVYSLLDVMQTRGAFDKDETFNIDWAGKTETVSVKPFDWLGEPLSRTVSGGEANNSSSAVVGKKGPGLAFASLSAVYLTDAPADESPAGLLNVSRKFFLRAREGQNYILKPLVSGATVAAGEQVEVQLEVNAKSRFEYVHIKDPRGAGFEGETLLSGWKWDLLGRYEEPRDSLTNFFVEWLPHGEYTLKYRIRPTTPGSYRISPATLQSLYAPEFAAHSDSFVLNVRE